MFLCSVHFFPRKSCLIWDNGKKIVDPDRPQMTTWRMRISRWIPKAISRQSEYVILIALPAQNGYRFTPYYYVTCGFSVLLALQFSVCFNLHPFLIWQIVLQKDCAVCLYLLFFPFQDRFSRNILWTLRHSFQIPVINN
jgi:hypothetical protein